MIEVEEITKKFAKVYHTVDDIEHFLLRVRLEDVDRGGEQIQTFKWQQKRFAPQERRHYKDLNNCQSDLARRYHQLISDEDSKHRPIRRRNVQNEEPEEPNNETFTSEDNIIFSYIQEDNHTPDDTTLLLVDPSMANARRTKRKPETTQGCNNDLVRLIQDTLLLDDINNDKKTEYDFFTSLEANCKTPGVDQVGEFEVMYIMADFGEYYQSTWIKSEYILCTLRYNRHSKLLIMSPEFTGFTPQSLKVTSDETRTILYRLENASLDGVTTHELRKEIALLHQVNTTSNKPLPLWTDTAGVHVFLEIQSAWGFEHPHIFIRYHVVLTGWKLLDEDQDRHYLTGVTPTCSKPNAKERLHFGFPIDFVMVEEAGDEQTATVYFELISKHTWSRFRSEGLTYTTLPVDQPGRHNRTLSCFRLTSSGRANELRRFFIGDCTNYEDLTAIGPNRNESVSNRLATSAIGTGDLRVRISVLRMRTAPVRSKDARAKRLRHKLDEPRLLQSVKDVVDEFRKARAAMLAARQETDKYS